MRDAIALLLLAVVWGLSIPVTKVGLETLSPMGLTALRFAIAVPLLLVFPVGKRLLPRRAVPRVAALGVLGIGVGQVAQSYGVDGASASVGTVISATIPVFVVFFAALRLKQPVSRLQQLGLLAAFAGMALVAFGYGQEGAALQQTTLSGAACLLLSALAIAFYYVWSVELTVEFGAATVAAWSTLFGFVALVPWATWEAWNAPIRLTLAGFGAAAYLGVVVTAVGLFLWLKLLRTVPARIAASVQFLQPIIGVGAASVMLGDVLGAMFIVGVLFVLAGLALTIASPRNAAPGVRLAGD